MITFSICVPSIQREGGTIPILDRVYRGSWRYESTTDIISYYVVKTILGKSLGALVTEQMYLKLAPLKLLTTFENLSSNQLQRL
jgi:hypothetical protein